jgi:hypothetical protein
MRLLGACLVVLAIGCGGKSAEQVCSDSAKANCALLDMCRKNGTADTYGSLGVCIQRQHDNCLRALTAPGTGNTPDHVDACNKALPGETCTQFLQATPVAACAQTTGAAANAAACAFNAQCQTGFCAIQKGNGCGTCANVPVAGDACDVITACGPGMTCTPMQVCQPWVQAGAACDTMTKICAPGSSCVIAAGATTGTCTADAATVGAACDNRRQTGPLCDSNQGLWCNAMTKMCVAITYVNAGSVCGSQTMGTADNVCTGGALCFASGVAGTPPTCLADAQEGAACDIMAGPSCLSPARCVVSGAGTAGTCALPDGTMCM